MTADDFRRLALSFDGASEGSHMRHPDFRAGGKIFASLGYPDPSWGMVKLPAGEQHGYLAKNPDVFTPAAGAWGRGGSIMVRLRLASTAMLQPAMEAAWHGVVATKDAKRAKKVAKTKEKPAAKKTATRKPKTASQEDPRLEHISKICAAWPRVERVMHGSHAQFLTRKKTFAYFLDNHHGDGKVALAVRALPGDNTRLSAANPDRYYLPAYVGPRGWVALRLDRGKTAWSEVKELLLGSYLMVAPPKRKVTFTNK